MAVPDSSALPPSPLAMAWQAAAESLVLTTCRQRRLACHAVANGGAVNGVVGMFLVLFPNNEISCYYLWWMRAGEFSMRSVWLIVMWLAFDIWGAASGGGGVAYFAHLGGFGFGAVTMVVWIKLGWAALDEYDYTLFHVLGLRK